jgi:hypothetical protein
LTKGGHHLNWTNTISYFFGGAFLVNAIQHIVSGVLGRAFQTPFAKPPGKGFSSSSVNVLWGFFNVMVAYLLIVQVGDFNLRSLPDVLAMGTGSFLIALFSAYNFGKLYGGNSPEA